MQACSVDFAYFLPTFHSRMQHVPSLRLGYELKALAQQLPMPSYDKGNCSYAGLYIQTYMP